MKMIDYETLFEDPLEGIVKPLEEVNVFIRDQPRTLGGTTWIKFAASDWQEIYVQAWEKAGRRHDRDAYMFLDEACDVKLLFDFSYDDLDTEEGISQADWVAMVEFDTSQISEFEQAIYEFVKWKTNQQSSERPKLYASDPCR
jgi:hypothetical protein